MGVFIDIILFCVFLAGATIWRGFVLVKLWEWFSVPIFSAPKLSIAAAVGISVLISLFVRDAEPLRRVLRRNRKRRKNTPIETLEELLGAKDEAIEEFVVAMSTLFLLPAFALLFGWITHLWM